MQPVHQEVSGNTNSMGLCCISKRVAYQRETSMNGSTRYKPRCMPPISSNFFQTRIVRRANAHIRAFASEVLTAIVLFGFFVVAVVRLLPTCALLPRHLACFDLHRIMASILQRGQFGDVDTLRNATQMHHVF